MKEQEAIDELKRRIIEMAFYELELCNKTEKALQKARLESAIAELQEKLDSIDDDNGGE